MRAFQSSDPRDLSGARILEIHIFTRQAKSLGIEETLSRQPGHRVLPQIRLCDIEVAELGLVADDRDRGAMRPAAAEKAVDPGHQQRILDTDPVSMPLQRLPAHLAIWKKTDGVANQLLGSDKGGGDKPLIAGSFEKHVVITEDRVIEIDPDPQQSGCARTRHYASASLTVQPPQASCGCADAAVSVSSATDASAAAADRATVSVTRILESNAP